MYTSHTLTRTHAHTTYTCTHERRQTYLQTSDAGVQQSEGWCPSGRAHVLVVVLRVPGAACFCCWPEGGAARLPAGCSGRARVVTSPDCGVSSGYLPRHQRYNHRPHLSPRPYTCLPTCLPPLHLSPPSYTFLTPLHLSPHPYTCLTPLHLSPRSYTCLARSALHPSAGAASCCMAQTTANLFCLTTEGRRGEGGVFSQTKHD